MEGEEAECQQCKGAVFKPSSQGAVDKDQAAREKQQIRGMTQSGIRSPKLVVQRKSECNQRAEIPSATRQLGRRLLGIEEGAREPLLPIA